MAVKFSGDISTEAVRGQKIEEHVTGLDLRNDENRLSLTSGAVAGKRQEVSSKNTMDEMADAITEGKDIGLWSTTYRFCIRIWDLPPRLGPRSHTI